MSADGDARFLLSWRPASVLAVFAAWTGLAALSVVGGMIAFAQAGQPVDVSRLAVFQAINWYSCAAFTPLYVWMARRWPIERAIWRRRVLLLLGVTAAVVPLRYAIEYAGFLAFLPERTNVPLSQRIIAGFVPETVAFWAMIAVVLSIEYYDRWRHREVQAHVLGRQLAEARLEVLSAQLRPHFLFNTLQGISTLIHRDPQAADQMLARLSDLLRQSLQSKSPQVSLADELDTLEHYLAIQRVRFQDRLGVHVSVDGARDALVPHFILQPLVENAIEHGIARRRGPGTIDIRAELQRERLLLTVTDDGDASAPGPRRTPRGVGLANVRARLDAMYGDDASLVAAPRELGGFAVTISVPLRRGAAGDT